MEKFQNGSTDYRQNHIILFRKYRENVNYRMESNEQQPTTDPIDAAINRALKRPITYLFIAILLIFLWYILFHQTWEQKNRSRIIDICRSIADEASDDEAIKKHTELVGLIGQNEIETAFLKAEVADAQAKITTIQRKKESAKSWLIGKDAVKSKPTDTSASGPKEVANNVSEASEAIHQNRNSEKSDNYNGIRLRSLIGDNHVSIITKIGRVPDSHVVGCYKRGNLFYNTLVCVYIGNGRKFTLSFIDRHATTRNEVAPDPDYILKEVSID